MLGLIKQAWTLAGASLGSPPPRVPIAGLPEGASAFLPGYCYFIVITSDTIYRGFVGGLVDEARRARRAARLLGFDESAYSVPTAMPGSGGHEYMPTLRSEAESSGLLVLEMAEAGLSEIMRIGAEGFLRRIEETLFPPGGLLLIADPESCFMDVERAQGGILEPLVRWAEAWNHTVVFVGGGSESPIACPPFALSRFGGIAEITAEWQRLYWRVERWRRSEGTALVRADFAIHDPEGNGRLASLGARVETQTTPLAAPDDRRVIVTREIADHDRGLPPAWEVLDDPYDFEDYLAGALAPTLVIHFDLNADFDRLARLVEQIRHDVGGSIKLVLRETDLRIRHYQERILLHIGLNLVVHAYERTEVLLWAIEALRGARSPSPPSGNVLDQLLRVSQPPALRGYLPPLDFCDALLQHLGPANPFDIDHALIRLKLLPGISPQAALAAYRANRRGDLITADGSRLYLFLFGCGRADIPVSLVDGFPPDVRDYLLVAREWTETLDILESLRGFKTAWAQPPIVDDAAQRPESP